MVRADRNGRSRPSMLCWGLVPGWARDSCIGHKLINARAETARIKLSFRAAFASRRCLIPADGFYEWKREGGPKQPWLIGMKDRGPFAFAGLWEHWTACEGAEPVDASAGSQSGEGVETFTILTTAANEIVVPSGGGDRHYAASGRPQGER